MSLLLYANQLRTKNLDSAFNCIRVAYKSAMELKSDRLQGESALSFAKCEDEKGNHKGALKYFFMAANHFKRCRDDAGLSRCYTGMGISFWYQGLMGQAVEYFNKNIAISARLKDEFGLATSYGNLAIIFDEKGELDSSLAYYNKALKIFEEGSDRRQLAACYDNMSIVYLQKKDFRNALLFHDKGYQIRKQEADTFGILASLENLASIHLKQKNTDKAIEISRQAYELALRLHSTEDLKYSFINLRDAFAQKGDYRSAFEYQSALMRLKDSLRQEENLNQTAELEARFRNKEKEAELNEIKLEQKLRQQENENRNKKKNLLITILIVSVASFLLIAFLLFRRFREKQRVANELKAKNEAISIQKIIIDKAYMELAEINKDLTDSIRYAKRIQEAIFPPASLQKELLPQSFVFFRPKDIVSGDFYYTDRVGDDIYFAVVDCTGHGVPGAFMSIVGYNLINKALHEHKKTSPAEILNHINRDLNETLRQTLEESIVKDGMDMTLCRWNKRKGEFEYAAANHVLYQVREGRLIIHKGDKHAIGAFYGEDLKLFQSYSVSVNPGDCIYLTSDGFPDQFGGPKGKKFKYKQLEGALADIHHLPIEEQMQSLEEIFNSWKGKLEQVDDVCIYGLRIG